MTMAALAGRRILLVEDESLIAMLLETALEDEGCIVAGPFARLDDALQAADTAQFDGALMDVNLSGERVFPLAEILWAKSVPFLLLSGYGEDGVPDDRPHWPVMSKPFQIDRVLAALGDMMAAVR